MAGVTPKKAVENFRDPLRKALSCFSMKEIIIAITPKKDGDLCCIETFGVEPSDPDWKTMLGKSQMAYETWRTWAGSGPSGKSE